MGGPSYQSRSKDSTGILVRFLARCSSTGDVENRPVIVVSYKNTLTGPCLVVPVSSERQDNNPWAHRLSIPLEGDVASSWAVCNHPATLSPSRFVQFNHGIPVLPKEDFNQVLEKLIRWLPKPFELDT